jgi:hypothetical protein
MLLQTSGHGECADHENTITVHKSPKFELKDRGEPRRRLVFDPRFYIVFQILREYFSAFRLIVAESFGIDGTKQKYDNLAGGRNRWLERVEQVRLAAMTPERVQRWKVAFLKHAGTDPVKVRTARTSVNSLLRKASGTYVTTREVLLGCARPLFAGLVYREETFDGIDDDLSSIGHRWGLEANREFLLSSVLWRKLR